MARTRRDDDFDDEDYEPLLRRRDTEGRRAYPAMLLGGFALAALVVAGLFVFVISRTRVAMERATETVAMEREAAVARMKQVPTQTRTIGANWAKLVGTWSRKPDGKEDSDYPYRFEFRADHTCTMTRANPGGDPIRRDSRVEVLVDEGAAVRLKLHVNMGVYSYQFHLKPDGTLTLDDGKVGLVFTRDS